MGKRPTPSRRAAKSKGLPQRICHRGHSPSQGPAQARGHEVIQGDGPRGLNPPTSEPCEEQVNRDGGRDGDKERRHVAGFSQIRTSSSPHLWCFVGEDLGSFGAANPVPKRVGLRRTCSSDQLPCRQGQFGDLCAALDHHRRAIQLLTQVRPPSLGQGRCSQGQGLVPRLSPRVQRLFRSA